MAEEGPKKKAQKGRSKAQESGVLGALPATRPSRLGRHARTEPTTAAAPPKPRAKPKRKPKAPAKSLPAKPVAEIGDAAGSRPTAVRAGSPKLKESIERSDSAGQRPSKSKAPSGTELAKTVVQAAGELAQVGVTVSGQLLKRAVEKLPKP